MGNIEQNMICIEGTLLMLDDATPHVAVPVQAIHDGKVMDTVLSDERGKYQFVNLKSGEYQLRCQVLGGYVYYKVTGKLTTSCEDDTGDTLQLEYGEAIRNINFRFAPFKKGTWSKYSYVDGLADNWVESIYCDSSGVMWFGTHGGASRYDGKTFVNFAIKDGLANKFIRAIHSDPDGVMWFGTSGGVARYNGKTFANLATEDGLAHNWVDIIYRDPDGLMWFGTDGGVSRYDGKEFINLTTEDGLAHNTVYAIHQDPDGIMWFGTDGGISRYDGNTFVNFTTEDGLANNSILTIYRDPDGLMWFGTDGGVSRYDGKEFVNLTTEDGLAHNTVYAIHRDPDGVMWFGTHGGGVSRYNGNTFVNFTTKDGLADNRVSCIHQNPDGVMWFATMGGGISRYDPNALVTFTTKDGLAHNSVYAIYSDPGGVMWFGTRGGVSRYDGKEFLSFTTKDGLVYNAVNVIHRDLDGVMWFGTGNQRTSEDKFGGISKYDGKEFLNFTTKDGLAHNLVLAIHCDSDGIIWFGTRGGVSRYDGKEFVNLTTKDGLANDQIHAIHRDPCGIIWFATGDWTSEGGISKYDGKEFVNFTTRDGLAHNNVNAICRNPDGVMWFATTDGVSWYNGEEFVNFTTEDGLTHNFTNAICRDTNGVMWFATDGGVSAYDGVTWTSLDTRDGLAGRSVISVFQDSDGFLWFGAQTEDGITRYRRSTTKPKVYIVSVTIDKTYSDLSDIPAFTPNTRVTIEYNAIDLKTLPEKRQYRYRIREIDKDWHKPTKASSFDYVFDKPGIYTFEVQAIDRDLNYSEPATIKLEVISDPRNHRIAHLEEQIREHERAEMERIYQELENARQIQLSLLPTMSPQIKGFDLAGISLPAREVSGDFYDYLSLDRNIGIVLADVTGKSVQAAMVAAMVNGMLHTSIRGQRTLWNSPKQIFTELNADLQPRIMHRMFTAMSLGILQVDERRLLLTSAGMPYPILKRGSEIRELKINGLPLGIVSDVEYEELSIVLKNGDFVVFYSDGVIEATNEAKGMYETERFLELIQQVKPELSAQEMLDLIIKDVTEFMDGQETSDDITVVVLRCKD